MLTVYYDEMGGLWCKVKDVCWWIWWDGWAMISSERCWLTLMMEWMGHDTKWTMFADYYYDGMDGPWYKVNGVCWLLWGDGWTIIQRQRGLLTNMTGWFWLTIKPGMDGPWCIVDDVCWLHIIMMGWMGHDIKWTMFADHYDGMDGP